MKTKSAKRSLGSLTLAFQSFAIFFAMLAAFGLKVADGATVWVVGLALALVAIALPGLLGRRGGYAVGWALQILMLAISIYTIVYHWLGYVFLVFAMVFFGLWSWAMITGGTIDSANRVLEKQNTVKNVS